MKIIECIDGTIINCNSINYIQCEKYNPENTYIISCCFGSMVYNESNSIEIYKTKGRVMADSMMGCIKRFLKDSEVNYFDTAKIKIMLENLAKL